MNDDWRDGVEPGMAAPQGGLAMVTTGRTKKPRRTLVYGVHGVGKSTFAAGAPSPIFLPTEEGVNDLDVAKFPLIQTYDAMTEALQSLGQERHNYKTVVVDSIDWLERLIWAEVCRQENVDKIDAISYYRGYGMALVQWRYILMCLDYLRDHRGMGVVLIGHAKVEKFESPGVDAYDRYQLKLDKRAAGVVAEWSDECLFATYEVFVVATEGRFGKKGTKAIGKGDRILRCQERPFAVAKNRLGMPEQIPMNWDAYQQYIDK